MDKTITRTKSDFYSDLAYRWAPINYQHVNLAYPRRDMLCSINYDGDWITSNNRKNIVDFDLIPVAYYATAETGTHYYILYCYYHADDLTHENDLEGCLLIVSKEDEELLAMITVAHWNFYSYVLEGRLKAGRESIDGKLYVEKYDGKEHPMIRQERNKHGLYAWRGAPWWMFWEPRDSKRSTGIRYVPSDEASMADIDNIGSFKDTECGYVLIDILDENQGFWGRRDDPLTFMSWGIFNSSTRGSANAPWVWDDFDDSLKVGTIFLDPATIAQKYFSGFDDFDDTYKKRMEERCG